MLRLFVKDNTSGRIHEYGTDKHDALILQKDGSLHYENMQCCAGTEYPDEGYSFCLADGSVPPLDDPEIEPYVDIGGEYYTKPKTNADRIRAMSDEELADLLTTGHGNFDCSVCKGGGLKKCDIACTERCIEWLKQPAEDEMP